LNYSDRPSLKPIRYLRHILSSVERLQGITMRILICLGLMLAATAADAQTYTTIVNRETKTSTTTGPTATATTTEVARTANSTTYTTTVTRNGGGYQPMGAGGYRPMGR
jgi:hypothetical protein